MNDVEKIERLIVKGNDVLRTHRPNPPGVIGFPTLDSEAFAAWQTQCLNFLESRLPSNNPYVRAFKEKIQKGYQGTVKAGIGILESVKEDLESDDICQIEEKIYNPLETIRNICDRFHFIVRQLRSRHDDRETLDVQDEYDAQDLFHALLHLFFDDIRAEEWTPSYAGKASSPSFLVMIHDIP